MTDNNALTLSKNPNISWGETPPPALIQDNLSEALARTLDAAMNSIFPAFRSISFNNNAFHIKDGKTKQTLLKPNGTPEQLLSLVVLNVAPDSYCSWWEGGYKPGSNTPPTAVWVKDGPLPPNVPDWVINTKKEEKGKQFKHYSVKRRTVVALARQDTVSNGVVVQADTPYVMDIGESSLFMPDAPPLYSFLGFLKLCQSYNTYPFSMVLQLQFDFTGGGAPNTIRFSPYVYEGKIRFFASDLFNKLRQVAASPEITRLLELNTSTSNNYGDDDYQTAPAPTQSVQAVQAVQAAQPAQPAPKPRTKPTNVAVAQPMGDDTVALLAQADAAMAQAAVEPDSSILEGEIIDEPGTSAAEAALAANMNDLLGSL